MAANRQMVSSLMRSTIRALPAAITGLGGLSDYAANGFDPKFVADFTADGDYFRVAGNDATFSDAFTSDSEAGGLVVQKDSSGNAVWGAHNVLEASEDFSTWSTTTTVNATWTANAAEFTGAGGYAYLGLSSVQFLVAVYTVEVTITADANVADVGVVAQRAGVPGSRDSELVTFVAGVPKRIRLDAVSISTAGTDTVRIGIDCRDSIVSGTNTDLTGITFTFEKGAMYRSDLGGMADVPPDERAVSSLNKYVPTTTAARYLLRRGHYDYDGSTYNRTCLNEPEGATNELDYSRDFSQWTDLTTAALSKDATGFDGVANSAYTLTDNNSGTFEGRRQRLTIPSDTNPLAVSFLVGKDASPASYPAVQVLVGSNNLRYLIDPSDGSLVARSTSTAADATYVENWNDDFWRVTLVTSNTNNSSCDVDLYPAVNTDGSATWDSATTGSHVFDQADLVLNASIPSSPIITAGAAVTRSADTMKGKAASLPYSSTAMSLAFVGSVTYADDGDYGPIYERRADGANLLYARLQRQSTRTGELAASQEAAGVLDSVDSADTLYSPGVSVPLTLAVRHTDSAIGAASGGTQFAENTTPTALPDVSSNDIEMGSDNGGKTQNMAVDTIRLWDEDIETAGIEEATA